MEAFKVKECKVKQRKSSKERNSPQKQTLANLAPECWRIINNIIESSGFKEPIRVFIYLFNNLQVWAPKKLSTAEKSKQAVRSTK